MQKSKRKIIIWGIVVIVVGFVVFRVVTSLNNNNAGIVDETANIKVTQATIANIEVTSPITGRIEPVEQVSIIPKLAGEVTNVYVALGDKVEKGALLFTLDGTQMQSALSQANAGYAQANAGHAQANAGYNNAVSAHKNAAENYARIQALYNEGAVSQQQYDQAKLQLDSAAQAVNQAAAAVNQAKAGINQARAGVSSAADGASNTKITAPISGYVTAVNVVKGGIASQAMAAVSISNIDTVEINCAVAENLINKIQVGDPVAVLVKSVSDEVLEGTITALSPAPATGSLTYPIKVSIQNPDIRIKPGMFAEVVVASEKLEQVLTLPSGAVIIKGGKTVVATVSNETALFKEVVVGLDNGQLVEIKSGLTAQDIVVIEGQYYLEDDDPVNIINE